MWNDTSFKLLVFLVTYFLYMFHSNVCAFPEDKGCVRIKNCPAALSHAKNVNKDRGSLAILRKAHCGFIGSEPVVRCGDIPNLNSVASADTCIPLQDCQQAVRLMYDKFFDPQVVNLLRSVHCGENDLQPLVYCNRVALR